MEIKVRLNGGRNYVKKVGILANGGDVSGFNAVIRAIVKTAENHGVECYGIVDGYNGLLKKTLKIKYSSQWRSSRNFTKRWFYYRFINKCKHI